MRDLNFSLVSGTVFIISGKYRSRDQSRIGTNNEIDVTDLITNLCESFSYEGLELFPYQLYKLFSENIQTSSASCEKELQTYNCYVRLKTLYEGGCIDLGYFHNENYINFPLLSASIILIPQNTSHKSIHSTKPNQTKKIYPKKLPMN